MTDLYVADKFLTGKTVKVSDGKHISCATATLPLTTTVAFSWEGIKGIVATRKKAQTSLLAHNKECEELGDIEAVLSLRADIRKQHEKQKKTPSTQVCEQV